MNNFSLTIKKMFGNKNFVTAICFLLIGVILIVGYKAKVNSALSPIRVPYALQDIPPRTPIRPEMIDFMEVARDSVNEEYILTKETDILNKYSNLDSTIYAGSFFYKNAVVDRENLPGQAITELKPGLTPLSFKTDMFSSYYNSLVPGDYFDLYVRTIGKLPGEKDTEPDEIIVGRLIEDIQILAVARSGDTSSDATGDTEAIQFAVPEEQALLLLKAEMFAELSEVKYIEFIIIPRGKKYAPSEAETIVPKVSSKQLEEYIKAKTKDIKVTAPSKTPTKE